VLAMKGKVLVSIAAIILGSTLFLDAGTNEVAPGVLQIGTIQNSNIIESSGLVPGRSARGLYWTHNDSGLDVLYAMTATGADAGEYKIKDVEIQDWEDIALAGGRLYIADIGNNTGARGHVDVYAVREPKPPRLSDLRPLKHWRLNYPGDPFDAESFVVSRGYGYVISKELAGGEAPVYRFHLGGKSEVTLEEQCRLNVNAPPAGADITADGKRFAVITREGAYLFEFARRIPTEGKLEPAHFTPFVHDRMEGCCFTRDGLLVTSETREIYLFTDPAFRLNAK
jgi:hypothetical protein